MAFIRRILDAVLIANKAIDSRMSQKKPMGFGSKSILWIKFCISTVKFLVLINGSPEGFLYAQRGIRQGDPLSPFLFIIAMEGLNNMLKISKTTRRIQEFEVSSVAGNCVEISHLQYAEDTLIICGLRRSNC
ncbi:uncharacterized mitochondrial protein AtMg01250-like [Solanum lycopersicum]|uniref:uncharacterized mitochondrial protein AtMg01250-like n=1 Tax=Solanum lycopersicum TaxID=4081 RepID=UPI0002BC9AFE|nr:uncharacterized protein LOC109119746 [Solanum lycopersicum]